MSDLYTLRRALTNLARGGPSDNPGEQARVAAAAAYQAALAAAPPLWAGAEPVLLTPVRLEVRYLLPEPGATAPELAIRAVPDDVAQYSFEPELTADEHAAGQWFWDHPGAEATQAWATIIARLGHARGCWAVEAMRPESPLRSAPLRKALHPAKSLLLPDRFTFRGWRGDDLIFDVAGADIPAGLQLGPDFDPDSTSTAGLWTGPSAWLVDLDEAVQVGMAVRVPLSGPNLAFDRLTVVGVSSVAADEGADRWAATLQGHLYTRGLAAPPVGAPTNNTDTDRAEWSSAPQLRTPEEVDAAVGLAGSGQPAVLLADAFGLPETALAATAGRRDLLSAQGGTTTPIADAVRDRAYRAFGSYQWTLTGNGIKADWKTGTVAPNPPPAPIPHFPGSNPVIVTPPPPTQTQLWLASDPAHTHFLENVRADGPLPPLRVGRQPYGVLPVTSIVSWGLSSAPDVPDDLLRFILTGQQRLTDRWLGTLQHLNEFADQDQDPVLLALLQRLPGSDTLSGPARIPLATPDLVDGTVGAAAPPLPLSVLPPLDADPTAQINAVLAAAAAATGGSSAPSVFTAGGLYWTLQSYASFVALWVARSQPAGVSAGVRAAMATSLNGVLAPLRDLADDWDTDCAYVDRQLAGALEAWTYRLDAWATSVATARLRAQRQSTPTGLHVGMYGWLVDVEPLASEQRNADDGWVLAPSPQHAVSAAVLLAGAQAHSETAFDIDLRSDRARRAVTILSGLRSGSTLEELLGYQLERALHDHQLDHFIAPLRTRYPLPLADVGDDAAAQLAAQAHGARLIVDGNAVRLKAAANNDVEDILAELNIAPAQRPAQADAVNSLIDDLDVTVDAVADLLLAEGVHHLVGGSPLRAGLAVDTVGKATPVPDRFDVISTPTTGVSVVHTVALAVSIPASSAWPISRRAELDPAAEALAQWAFGEPEDWQVTDAAGQQLVALTDLGVAAIDLAVELTEPADNSALAARIRAHPGVGSGPVRIERTDQLGGPDAAPAVAAAVRTVLGHCRAVDNPMQAVDADAASTVAVDVAGLADRVDAWRESVRDAVSTLSPDAGADPAPGLIELARLGFTDVRVDTPASGAVPLYRRWVDATELKATAAPPAGAADGWRDTVASQLNRTAGPWCTAAPLFAATDSSWTMLAGESPPGTDHDADAIADWFRDYVQVRAGLSAVSDLLSLSGACGAGREPDWLVLQHSAGDTDGWVARNHPGTRSAAALTALQIGDPAAGQRALLMVDQWVEPVPAAAVPDPSAPDPATAETFPVQEAALTVRFDSPDSRAPQSILLVTAPDPQRGWRADDIHAAVEDTLWWARARPVDTYWFGDER